MTCWVARPRAAARTPRGVIVFQEGVGVNDYLRDVAGRFAARGFTAIAPEMFHRSGDGVELAYGDIEAQKPHRSKVSAGTIAADATAAYTWLTSVGGVGDAVAAIGFCMGGRCAFIANASLPLKAAVSFYGGIMQTDLPLAAKQSSRILMFWAGRDANILPEHTRAVADALDAAEKDNAQITFSYADHGFFCDARPVYNEGAARQAWALTSEYFRVQFGDPD